MEYHCRKEHNGGRELMVTKYKENQETVLRSWSCNERRMISTGKVKLLQ